MSRNDSNVTGINAEIHKKMLELAAQGDSLKSGGGGGTFDGMEERVKHLEDDMREIKTDMKAVRSDLAELKGKVGMLPGYPGIALIMGVFVALGTLIQKLLPALP